MKVRCFAEFNALRKNQLLMFYDQLQPMMSGIKDAIQETKYRDYYFMPQYEVGQQELIDAHYYTYALDLFGMQVTDSKSASEPDLRSRVLAVNQVRRELSAQKSTSEQEQTLLVLEDQVPHSQ